LDTLSIRRVRLDAIHPDPANARQHPERNLEAIENSLRRFGRVEPLVVQKSS
jgi:ParB-like chromosome segregation protein Spo0J